MIAVNAGVRIIPPLMTVQRGTECDGVRVNPNTSVGRVSESRYRVASCREGTWYQGDIHKIRQEFRGSCSSIPKATRTARTEVFLYVKTMVGFKYESINSKIIAVKAT